MTQITAIPVGSSQSIAQTKPAQLAPTTLQKRFLESVTQSFSQLSHGEEDTKVLKRNYIEKKKKKEAERKPAGVFVSRYATEFVPPLRKY